MYFFFNVTAPTEIYTYLHTLSRHDALPIWGQMPRRLENRLGACQPRRNGVVTALFEHSPWVETRADARPSSGDRHADLMAVVREASADRKSTRLNSSH